jgi:outer membrane receptor protein involved in Fe transport
MLNEITVNSRRPPIQRVDDKLVLNVAGNVVYKTAVNAFDVLKKVPGLQVNADGTMLLSGRNMPAVFIDGKPTPMSELELQNYLASIAPDMIASIEVIANPSSKYDGEYKGIIDIKLKRDKELGWNGTLTGTVQQNAYTYTEDNFTLTYKAKKIAYTARAGYAGGSKIYRYNALQHLANTNIMSTGTETQTRHNNYNVQLSMDYNISSSQRLGVWLKAFMINRQTDSRNMLHTTDSSSQTLISDIDTKNIAAPEQDNYAANLDYNITFGKQQLQLLGSLSKISNGQNEDIQTKDRYANALSDYWKTNLKNDILIRMLQADLSGNVGKGKYAAGAKFVFNTTKNDLHYDTLNWHNEFVTDSGRTNNFQYDEYLTSLYATYDIKLNKLAYSFGLRAEHTHSFANAITQGEVTKRDYLTWLPNINVTYKINPDNQLNFSFTRRLTRPTFAQLNPFRFYNSPLNYWVGNPTLLPSKTNTFNVSYTYKTLNVSLNAGRETDPLARYPEYDSATNVLEYLGRNLPYNDFASVEASLPVAITRWWKTTNNAAIYYKREQTPYHKVTYTIPVTSFSFNTSHAFTLPKGFVFDVYYYYSSRGGNGLYVSRSISNLDAGLQKNWLRGKINSRLNVYDVFNTYRVYFIFREKSIINNELRHWFGQRRVALTLTYNFGSSTHKMRQNKKNEEETRAGF